MDTNTFFSVFASKPHSHHVDKEGFNARCYYLEIEFLQITKYEHEVDVQYKACTFAIFLVITYIHTICK